MRLFATSVFLEDFLIFLQLLSKLWSVVSCSCLPLVDHQTSSWLICWLISASFVSIVSSLLVLDFSSQYVLLVATQLSVPLPLTKVKL
jgi:hypothetical protein